MSDDNIARAFFTKSIDRLLRQLVSEVDVISFDKTIKVKALWDTGATGTCISERAAKTLGLISVGKRKIQTPSGTITVNTYMVDIVLPNIHIQGVSVCSSKIGDQGLDLLIGMDIITLGDFAVSNYDGKTSFTFRIPSQKETDYVKEIQEQQT